MAGYSQTPLIKKLGIGENTNISPINAPKDYFDILGQDLSGQVSHHLPAVDLFHIFTVQADELKWVFTEVIGVAKNDAVIWISWYKKSAKMQTDVTEETIRAIVLPTGWVDVKVCAVNDVWSGLKIVKRLANR